MLPWLERLDDWLFILASSWCPVQTGLGTSGAAPHSPAGIAGSSYHTCCRISLLHQNSPSEWVHSPHFYLRLEIDLVEACNTTLLCAVAEFNN